MSGGGICSYDFLSSGSSRTAGRGSRIQACASERRARFLLRRTRKGFTLVEVIVVLVILAILAAIAIPALTGYIDKANTTSFKSLARTQKMALQTMVNLQYTRDGGFVPGTYGWNKAGTYFERVLKPSDSTYPGFTLWCFSKEGKQEYESLTGDTYSFRGNITGGSERQAQITYIGPTGNILAYMYRDYDTTYDNGRYLRIFDVNDIDTTDVLIQEQISANFNSLAEAKAKGLTSGINILAYKDKTDYEKLN
jgi:prepilin-type N-terminal cleavage/methylation domain-containing protein